jgi:hypothetical protein
LSLLVVTSQQTNSKSVGISICWIEENNDDLTAKSTPPPRDVSLSLRKILNSFDGKISLSKMFFVSHVAVINAMSVFSAIKKLCVQFMFEKTSSFALCMLVTGLLALIIAQFTVERESLSVECRFIVEFSRFRIAASKGPGLFSTYITGQRN